MFKTYIENPYTLDTQALIRHESSVKIGNSVALIDPFLKRWLRTESASYKNGIRPSILSQLILHVVDFVAKLWILKSKSKIIDNIVSICSISTRNIENPNVL